MQSRKKDSGRELRPQFKAGTTPVEAETSGSVNKSRSDLSERSASLNSAIANALRDDMLWHLYGGRGRAKVFEFIGIDRSIECILWVQDGVLGYAARMGCTDGYGLIYSPRRVS